MAYSAAMGAVAGTLAKDLPLRCGDCRQTLPSTSAGSATVRCRDPDGYCPLCRRPATEALECPYCGSWVCGQCGSILEPADELGIG